LLPVVAPLVAACPWVNLRPVHVTIRRIEEGLADAKVLIRTSSTLERMGHPVESGVARDRHVLQAIFAFGAVLTVLAALVRTWAAAYLRSEVIHDSKLHGEGLVADGPYRYVRNPLYLGSVLFAVGFAMGSQPPGFRGDSERTDPVLLLAHCA